MGGENENFSSKPFSTQPARQIQARHPVHSMISDDDIEGILGLFKQFHRNVAVVGKNSMVTIQCQNSSQRCSCPEFIVNNEDFQRFGGWQV